MTAANAEYDRLMAPLEVPVGEAEVHIEDEQEVEPVKVAHNPRQPTVQELEDHRCDHLPFRSWCKWCVMARGRGEQHCSANGSKVPRIGIDYFYITCGGVKMRDELKIPNNEDVEKARKEGEIVKCVLARCFESKAVFAHCIPCKGADEEDYVAKLLADDIAWIGYVEMIIKADNEKSLQALVRRVVDLVKLWSDDAKRVTKEEPAKYESQSNGGTEIGVRNVRGLFRTLKLCLESRIGKHVPNTHAMIPWLLEHTCTLLNARLRGEDGLTAWARVKGRAFNQRLLGFAEVVLYKLPSKGPMHDPDGNMGTRWREGIFLGYSRSANVYIVGTESGIVTSRSLTRRPILNRWSSERLAALKATPWSEREKPEVQVRFQEEAAVRDEQPAAPAAAPSLRRFRINKKDLEEFGFTDGCVQCDHFARYGMAKPGAYHTDACRTRILTELAKTELGQQRLTAWTERTNRGMAEYLERADNEAKGNGNTSTDDVHASNDKRETLAEAPHEGANPRLNPHDTTVEEPATGSTVVTRHDTQQGDETGGDDATPRNDEDRGGEAMQDKNAAEEEEPTAMDMGFIGSLEPETNDLVSGLLLQQLGSTGRSYKREVRKTFKHLVSEVYSPPRVTEELRRKPRRHLLPGFAFDLTTTDPDDGEPWDFTRRDKREKARHLLRRQRPFLLIGSPMCRAFSTWQYLNDAKASNPDAVKRQKIRAKMHVDFVVSLYFDQLQAGRYFLHEHPQWATSWQLPSIQQLMQVESVEKIRGDQCQFGAEIQRGSKKGSPILKPSGFVSNSLKILEQLGRRCTGQEGRCSRPAGGRHVRLEGSYAQDSQKYPRALCQAMLRGVTAQLRADRRLKAGCFGIQALDDDDEVQQTLYGPEQGYSVRYRDDSTGQVLKDELVTAARMKELTYFTTKGVWVKVPRDRARRVTGHPPITVRWVDVNKGDELNPNYRSRLVARQMKALDKSGQSFFAPAPPIEALRTVLSLAMTKMGQHKPDWNPRSPNRTQISFVDVTRAYFNAKIDKDATPTYVNLPNEDADNQRMCAQLLRHLYGTRMAADGWQEEYSTLLIRLGFRQGVACPNAFFHAERQITCSVHGDDFTSSGPKPALDWLESSIQAEYEVTIGPRLGPGPDDAKEARALNRIVRWCDDRVEYEADPRQVERLIEECGLTGCKTMATPSVKPTFTELEADESLAEKLHTAFRGSAARGNYLAADRIDSQFSCKEICRWMSKPTQQSWKALKRLCRYLSGQPRLVYVYRQQEADSVDVYTDTDWAGCPKTRKSTSGGCVLLGNHTIKHWSSTQASVTLSSGEAEFNGVIRGAGQGLGYQALLRDLGVTASLRVWTDSSAAIGICSRQGLGRLRHLDTHTLWIQQAVRNRRIDLRKVPGDENPADLLTKHSLTREKLHQLVKLFDCEYRDGRAESAPKLRKGDSTKVTMAQRGDDEVDLDLVQRVLQVDSEEEETDGGDPKWVHSFDPYGSPWMPHNVLGRAELDERFPSIHAPEDDELDDFARDEDDAMLQHGRSIASAIAEDMARFGRTRSERSPGRSGE